MSATIREALFARWSAAGLPESVAPLAFGDRSATAEPSPLPRASYVLLGEVERSRSRGSRELVQPVQFSVWAATDGEVETALEAMEAAFINSESAMLHPLTINANRGRILGVDFASREVAQAGVDAFHGLLTVDVTWMRPNAIPD